MFCFGCGRGEFDFVNAEFQEIDHAGWGDPLSFCVMMSLSCARKVVSCEKFWEGLPMIFVVLCDDVVHALFTSGRDEVSRIE